MNVVQRIKHQLDNSMSSWLKTRMRYFKPRLHAYIYSFLISMYFYFVSLFSILLAPLSSYSQYNLTKDSIALSNSTPSLLIKPPIMTGRRIRWADYRRPDRITENNVAQVPEGHFNWGQWRHMANPQGMQGYWNERRGQWGWRNGYQWGDARRDWRYR